MHKRPWGGTARDAMLALWTMSSVIVAVQAAIRTSAPGRDFQLIGAPVLHMQVITGEIPGVGAGAAALGANISFFPAMAGSALPPSARLDQTLDFQLMLPHMDDDVSACSGPLRDRNEFNQSFAGSFILLRQAACKDSLNWVHAAASGAAGIIAYACSALPPFNCQPGLVEMLAYFPLAIPLLAIDNADGEALVAFLQEQKQTAFPLAPDLTALQVQFVSSGPIDPAEREVLKSIMSVSTMRPFADGVVPEGLPPWSFARFNDSSLDPCINHPKGLWCERGHVVVISLIYHVWIAFPPPAALGSLSHLRYLQASSNVWMGPMPLAWCALTDLRSIQVGSQLGPMRVGALPDCPAGSWPRLEELSFPQTAIAGRIPAFVEGITTLRRLTAQENPGLTVMPSLALLSALEEVRLHQCAFEGPFPALHANASIRVLTLGTNRLSGDLPAAICEGRSALRIFDLNSNAFTGSIPSFAGCSGMQVLDLSSNAFRGAVPVGALSSMSSTLTSLYLQENQLHSPLFLNNLVALQHIDISHNKFNMSTLLNPAATDLGGFVDDIYGPSTVSIRASYNHFRGTWATSRVLQSQTIRALFFDHNQLSSFPREILASPATQLDFSSNDLQSAFGTVGVPNAQMTILNLKDNPKLRLEGLQLLPWMVVSASRISEAGENYVCAPLGASPAPLLTFTVDPEYYAFRYCECAAGNFGVPPLCANVPAEAALNPYALIRSTEVGAGFADLIEQTNGVGGQLLNPLFGTNRSAVSDGDVPSAPVFSVGLSDSMYGQNRLTLGMATSWVIRLSNMYRDDPAAYVANHLAPPSPLQTYVLNTTAVSGMLIPDLSAAVRVITVRLHLNRQQFSVFDDLLSLYEGGSDLKGARVFSIRGSDSLPETNSSSLDPAYLALYNSSLAALSVHSSNSSDSLNSSVVDIQIFSNVATLAFNSRKSSGTHFFASYSYSFDCPPGYFFDSLAPTHAKRQCRLNLVPLRISEGMRAAVFAMSSVALLFVLFNLLMLFLAWSSLVFKAASRSFMLLILILLALQSLGAMLYAVIPSPDKDISGAVCIGRAWGTCLPLAGILAVLLAKNYRLHRIFSAQTLQVKKHTDSDILRTVMCVCTIQIAILCVFSALPLSRPVTGPGRGGFSERAVTSCSQESGFMSWFAGELVFIGCLMLPAGYLGFKTRDLPSQYSESSHIQNALVLLLFFGVIIIPLDIFIQDTPEAAVLIQGLGQSLLCCILTLILFGPKLYYLSVAFKRNAAAGNGGAGGGMGVGVGLRAVALGAGTMAGTQLDHNSASDESQTGITPIGGLSRKPSSRPTPTLRRAQTSSLQPQQLPPLQPPHSPVLGAAKAPPTPTGGFKDLRLMSRQPASPREHRDSTMANGVAANPRPMPLTVIPSNARRQSSVTTDRASITASTGSSPRGTEPPSRTSAVQLTLMPDSPPTVFVPGPASPLYVAPDSRSPSSVTAAAAASAAPPASSPSASPPLSRRGIRLHLGSSDLGSGGVGAGGDGSAASAELSLAVDRLRRNMGAAVVVAGSPSALSAVAFPSSSPTASAPALSFAQGMHARSLLDKLSASVSAAAASPLSPSSPSGSLLPSPSGVDADAAVQQVALTPAELLLLQNALQALMGSAAPTDSAAAAARATAAPPSSHS